MNSIVTIDYWIRPGYGEICFHRKGATHWYECNFKAASFQRLLHVLHQSGIPVVPFEDGWRVESTGIHQSTQNGPVRRASPRPEDQELIAHLTRAAASGVGILF
ncbi:MAG: hypothetical protein DRJ03_29475 [Chloroflexi bacterium]|nr:MAG: hypothetical protein DRJ03_29475 [Chloroflexota bacterium]